MQELGVCRILSCFVEWWELAVNPGHLLGKWGSGWSQRSCWGENDIIWSLGKAELQLHGTAPVLAFSISSFIIKGYKGSPNTAGWGHGSLIQTDWDLLLSCREFEGVFEKLQCNRRGSSSQLGHELMYLGLPRRSHCTDDGSVSGEITFADHGTLSC